MIKTNVWSIASLLVAISISISTYATAPASVGTVIIAKGDVQLVRNNKPHALKRKEQLQKGDRIITGMKSRARLRMIDNAILTLGANTEFVINHYQYSANEKQGSARVELFKGVMRAVTGAIGKTQDRDFLLKTSAATIGVRGTDFWVGDIFSTSLDVALISGKGVYVENKAGRVEIITAGHGTTVKDQDTQPTKPKRWGDKKYNMALESVFLE